MLMHCWSRVWKSGRYYSLSYLNFNYSNIFHHSHQQRPRSRQSWHILCFEYSLRSCFIYIRVNAELQHGIFYQRKHDFAMCLGDDTDTHEGLMTRWNWYREILITLPLLPREWPVHCIHVKIGFSLRFTLTTDHRGMENAVCPILAIRILLPNAIVHYA